MKQVTQSPQDQVTPDAALDRHLPLRWEWVAFAVVIALAILTRFADLESRVMSHDESLHTYYSWLLAEGRGFQHTPLMHGPLQFHLVAASYALFGDSDAVARLPAALSGVLAVGLLWYFRRWLGKAGALSAAALMLVSPFMLYYARYVRNEAFVVVEALLMFMAVFRYVETRQSRWLYLLAAALALHVSTKETFFIYTAQLLVFLIVALGWQLIRKPWRSTALRTGFFVGLGASALGGLVTLMAVFGERSSGAELAVGEIAAPLDPTMPVFAGAFSSPLVSMGLLLGVAGVILLGATLILGFGRRLRTEFSYLDLLVVIGSLTLPLVSSFPAYLVGWDPLAYSDPQSVMKTGAAVIGLLVISAVIGVLWDWRRWLSCLGIFAAIFVPLHTTMFTNPTGLLSGLVGSLGYWLVQHGVERGSQPLYYYMLVQLPVYEFLPALGALVAGVLAAAGVRSSSKSTDDASGTVFPVPAFLAYWSLTSVLAYSFAGERMPWLTVHIALPMILLTGWGIGLLIDSIAWRKVAQSRGWLVLLGVGLLVLALPNTLRYLLGSPAPFSGAEMAQLQSTIGLLVSLGVTLGAIVLLAFSMQGWKWSEVGRLALAGFISLLFLLTIRASFRAAYIQPDDATEYLVYAHSAPAVKVVLEQVDDLSRRISDGNAIDVAYDDDVSWPYTWYLRNFPNVHYYGPNPTRDLLNYPVIIAGDSNWAKIEPLLGDRYSSMEYVRMWWPMQEYFGLTSQRLLDGLRSPEGRKALWDIWFYRDYTGYGNLKGIDYSLKNWNPSDRMKLFIRKDVVGQVWDYGAGPSELEPATFVDPYEQGMTRLASDAVLGFTGTSVGQYNRPRGVDVAPDGSLYVADSANHRIQHLASSGEVLHVWGTFADAAATEAPGGSFNEPWDVAVAPDGTVYVADTWNHRVQHFTADGRFLNMLGTFGTAESPTAFWGPRSVDVDEAGRLFVVDTGNKRIVVFDADGQYLSEIGEPGYLEGQFDEPVGVALGPDGKVYVADTWNQRIQVFEEASPNEFEPTHEWALEAWYGQSLDNKPFLAVSPENRVCASDPEGYRILCFDGDGQFELGWGDFGGTEATFDLPTGLAFESPSTIWVADTGNGRLMRFVLP